MLRLLLTISLLTALGCSSAPASTAGDTSATGGDDPFPPGLGDTDGLNFPEGDSGMDVAGGGGSKDIGSAGESDSGAEWGSGADSTTSDAGAGDSSAVGNDSEGQPDAPDSHAGEDAGPSIDTPLALTLIAEREGGSFATTWHVRIDEDGLRNDVHAPSTPHADPTIVAQFGGQAEPPSDEILVHAWAGWDAGGPVVVLVHGTGGWAELAFGDLLLGVEGMGSSLANAGYAVFAITFPHAFGDIRNQAGQLAAALQWARMKAGATKASVVAHSKGGVAAAAYVSGRVEEDGFGYQGEVESLILLGTPLGGMDYTFRHPNVGATASFWGYPVPSPWEATYVGFVETDTFDQSIYHPGFTGLQQLLTPWLDAYPLSMLEQDWYTTYHGGQGFMSKSRGIDVTVELGGNFMATLWAHEIPATIRAAIAAGGTSVINGVPWETDGPADGLVFVESATDTRMFEAPEAVTIQEFTILSHPLLVTDSSSIAWIIEQLGK